MHCTHILQVGSLKEMCGRLLVDQLTAGNCLQMLDTAYKYNIKVLKRRCNEVFVAHKAAIMKAGNATELVKHVPPLVLELLGIEPEENDS